MGENYINFLPNTETLLTFFLFPENSRAIPKGNVLFANGLQFQAGEVCRGGQSTAIHLPRLRNATQPECPTLWEPFSFSSLPAHPDQSQILGCTLSWDTTARAGGSWCCPQPCPERHPHPRESQFVSMQWENLSTPGAQWRLCLSGVSIHFCHRPPPVTICPWFPTACLEQSYLLCLSCLFSVIFWSCLLLCLLVCSVHCSFAGALEALLHH